MAVHGSVIVAVSVTKTVTAKAVACIDGSEVAAAVAGYPVICSGTPSLIVILGGDMLNMIATAKMSKTSRISYMPVGAGSLEVGLSLLVLTVSQFSGRMLMRQAE
jgi:hypothetical protein